MSITTKPYYKYKKDAFKSLTQTIIGILKRISSLENIVDFSATTIDQFEFLIIYSESRLTSIDVYYLGHHHLGTVRQPIFEYDPVRFYTGSEFNPQPFGVALVESERKIIEDNARILYNSSQNSFEIEPYGDVKATAFFLTVSYLDTVTSLLSGTIYKG